MQRTKLKDGIILDIKQVQKRFAKQKKELMNSFMSDRSMTMERERTEERIRNERKKTMSFIQKVIDRYNTETTPRIKDWARKQIAAAQNSYNKKRVKIMDRFNLKARKNEQVKMDTVDRFQLTRRTAQSEINRLAKLYR